MGPIAREDCRDALSGRLLLHHPDNLGSIGARFARAPGGTELESDGITNATETDSR